MKRNVVPIREQTYDYIKEKILAGGFGPGERLTEEHLAAKLGVSRTPVREALHRLEQEGLIKPLEKRGFCVADDSKEEMEELFEIRSVLEGYALRCACDLVTEELLSTLDAHISDAEKALTAKNTELVFHYNTRFHDTINDLVAHKPRLHSMMSDLRKYVLRYRRGSLQTLDGARRAIDGHKKIMLALRLRDPELCERVMRQHIEESKQDALQTAVPGFEKMID